MTAAIPTIDERKQELITNIEDGNFHLSYSSLKAFMKSPKHFIDYKLKPRVDKPTLNRGLVSHKLILEGDEEFNKAYAVQECVGPTSANMENFVAYMLQNLSAVEAHKLAYSKKNLGPEKRKSEAQEMLEKLGPYVEFVKTVKGRLVVKKDKYDDACRKRDAVVNDPAAYNLLERIEETEKFIEWEYEGIKHKGAIDMFGSTLLGDLKDTNAEPDKVAKQVINMGWGLQAAMYLTDNPREENYTILAIDDTGGVSVNPLSDELIEHYQFVYHQAIINFNKCKAFCSWDESYGFYGNEGKFMIEKPRYL